MGGLGKFRGKLPKKARKRSETFARIDRRMAGLGAKETRTLRADQSGVFVATTVNPEKVINPTQAPARRRHVEFDREEATYARVKPDLILRHRRQFFVFKGDEIEGPFRTMREAARGGWKRFGYGPIFVKRILDEDVVDTDALAATCHS